MTRGWRWESKGEYLDRMAHAVVDPSNVPELGPGNLDQVYAQWRDRLCVSCASRVTPAPCPYHRQKDSPAEHLLCQACGKCVDDLAP